MAKLPRIMHRRRVIPLLIGAFLLALLVSAASASVKPKRGPFNGTAGPYAIGFKVSANGKSVLGLRTSFQASTCGPIGNKIHVVFPTATIHKGHFSAAINPSSPFEAHYLIQGKFKTRKMAVGTIKVHFKFPHDALPPCHTSSSFTAKRVGK